MYHRSHRRYAHLQSRERWEVSPENVAEHPHDYPVGIHIWCSMVVQWLVPPNK